jgi:UDP-N-acetylmuramate dehydrogenase
MDFQRDKPLSEISTFGIGGTARYFIEVTSPEQLLQAITVCTRDNIAFLVIGKGSNVLFDDRGYHGLVILNKISFCRFENHEVEVGAGYSFSLLGTQTARKGLAGLEFASGIPGSVGGAIYMNAGADGKETYETLKEVTYLAEDGSFLRLKKEELSFSYRFSSFQKKRGVIVAARFCLQPSSEARQKQLKIIDYRTKTQPYTDKSAGCVFRNPHLSPSAGALIEKAGLKGMKRGGAEVSLLHGNFIVNTGGATAEDVRELIALVQKGVKEKMGVELELEIRSIPYDFSS